MSLPYGASFEQPSASAAKPHIFSFATARSAGDDELFEVWNGPTSAARVLRINEDGQVQLADGTVGAPTLAPEDDKDTGVYFVSGTPEVATAIAGSKVLSVVAAGVAVTGTLSATGGFDGTVGAVTPAAGTFTTVTASRLNPVSGAGIGVNLAALDNVLFKIGGAFTSGGVSTTAIGFDVGPQVTAAAGDTAAHALVRAGTSAGGTVTTQGQSETIAVVATAHFSEPAITVGSGDTVTVAATVYIANAPTEGSSNYALWVDAGVSRFDDNIVPGANDGAALGISGTAFSDLFLASGAVIDFDAGDVTITHSANLLTVAGGGLATTGVVAIGDTADATVTLGLVLNQGANDDNILTLKSSDVAHALVSGPITSETDTYAQFRKISPTTGGLLLQAISEDGTHRPSLHLQGFGGEASTSKTASDLGLMSFYVDEHDGAGSVVGVTADGACYSFRCNQGGSARTLFLIDEDGDYFYDGADGGAFDAEDDVALVRAFALATSKDVIRTEFDNFLKYSEDDLVRMGILGAPVAEGGLVNGAQLQRLLVGAVWQQAQRIKELERRIAA